MTVIMICDEKHIERQRALAQLLGEVVGEWVTESLPRGRRCLLVDVIPQVVYADER